MNRQSAAAWLHRLIGVPTAIISDPERLAGASLWVLADSMLSCAALAFGVAVGPAQAGSFIAVGALGSGLRLWRAGSRARWTLPWLLLAVCLLVLALRSGLIGLTTEVWGWPPYAAVVLAACVSGLAVQMARHIGTDLHWRALAVGVAGYAFCLRLIYSAQIELLPEEAYYWNYSRHLDIGYLDHPPGVAWLIRLGTTLFGDTQFGVRLGAICCGATAAFFVYRLTRNLFGERSALLVLGVSQVLPYFFFSGMLMTPDAPLSAAWAASMYFLERALVAGRGRAWVWAGLSMGIGLLSKYTIGMLGGAAVLFMVLDPPSRRWFRRWQPYAAVLVAAAVFAPVVVWNAQHDWASFAFQTSRRLAEAPRFSLHKLVGAALVLLTPIGLIAGARAFIGGLPDSMPENERAAALRPWRFLQIAVLVPVSVFVAFSLRHEVKLDWTGAPWLAALPMMALGLAEVLRAAPGGRLPGAWPNTMIAMLLIYAAGFYHLSIGIPGIGYSAHPELVPVEWRDFGRQVDDIAAGARARYGGDLLVVGMDRYFIASEMAFYSRDQAAAVAGTSSWQLFEEMGLMYERWFPVERQEGRTLLLVALDPATLASARVARHAASLEPVHEAALIRNGSQVRRYYYRVARGYRHQAAVPDRP